MIKNIVIIVLVLIILPEAGLIIYRNIKTPETNTISAITDTPASPPIPASVLSFLPETIYISGAQKYSADIKIETKNDFPTLIQVELAYDPEIISSVSLSPGDIFQNAEVLLNNIDQKAGRISYALSDPTAKKASKLSGTAAVITFTLNKKSGTDHSAIYFLPKTSVRGEGVNIPLTDTRGLEIQLNPPAASGSGTTNL